MALFSRKAKKLAATPALHARSVAAESRRFDIDPAAPRYAPPLIASLEPRIQQLGVEMLAFAKEERAGVLSKQFWSDKLMDWSMKDQAFKVQLFRFVDAFPALRTPEMVHEHLIDYLTQPGVSTPPGMDLGLRAGGLAKGLLTGTVSSQIKGMAAKFIAGVDAAGATPGLKKLWNDGIAFSVDLLGEACVSAAEADAYRDKYLDLINNLPDEAATWKAQPRLEQDHLGHVARVNVSIKVSSLTPICDALKGEVAIEDLMTRLEPILYAAHDKGVFVNFDIEQFAIKDFTLEVFMRCCEKYDFDAGLAMQAYLKSGDADANRICEWSKRTGRTVSVRLVKGAYWDYETIHAEEMGWPCPVWNTKSETDACFERMATIFLDATPRRPGEGGVKLALGSHNVRSIATALAGLESRGLPREAIEIQMLHGMADELKAAASRMGLRVREYVPIGEMIPGMAYLVRRLLENTSNESWLRAGFLDNASTETLLRSPHTSAATIPPQVNGLSVNGHLHTDTVQPGGKADLYLIAPERHNLAPAVPGVSDERPFFTEPLRDFADAHQRDAFAISIAHAPVPQVANDRTPADAEAALAKAHEAFKTWRDEDPRGRAAVLIRAANAMRSRRNELAGVIIRESGKTWREADGDVCEAIDFCEYYARLAIPLFERKRLGRFIGELDELWHQPRGVAAIISPWNFPLAICCGMAAAALVCGNTVVIKPAEQTPGIAKILVDILHSAGAPKDALHFIPAPGESTGASLVRDPRVAIIAFTGSKAVGLDIVKAAGVTPEEQPFVKRVVCEMGGKNALIIDTSADLDEAVIGVRQSAFSFQGQKCSACSRAIVVDAHYDTFVERLVESTRALRIGDPMHPATDIGPVIDEEAANNIRAVINDAKRDLRCALEMPIPEGLEAKVGKPFVGPTIFVDVPPDHRLAREEVFGPVLAVIHAKNYEEALRIANDSQYKLTGGVYSRKPSNLDRARKDFRVGNLYLNRGITGALVGRQPFGGFGMSGVGSKAGGPDYLLQFVEPRACTENTMRRGFAPEL